MSNKISFWELPSPIPLAVPGGRAPSKLYRVNFKLKGADFKAQFVSNPPAVALPVPPLFMALLAAALDTGYGAGSDEMLGMSATKWDALRQYQIVRLLQLTALMEVTVGPPITVKCAEFVDALERDEKVHMAYLLGSIFCRVATQAWVQQSLAPAVLQRFWHLKVARDAAVTLDFKTRPGGAKLDNPDFVFEAGTDWYTAEAKGSFGPESWAVLKAGLLQASKLEELIFFDFNAGRPQQKPIKGFTCTMAHFDAKSRDINVTHLDPAMPARAVPNRWTMVKEFADLVRFEQALNQFERLSFDGEAALPAWAIGQLTGMNWRQILPGAEDVEAVYLGMPTHWEKLADALRLALRVLRLVVPVCARAASGDTDERFKSARRRLARRLEAASQDETDKTPSTAAFWQELIRMVMPAPRHAEPLTWQTMLTAVSELALPLGPPDADPNNIRTLAEKFAKVARATVWQTQITAKFGQAPTALAPGLRLIPTTHGLLLASGTWQPGEPKREEPKSKL